MKREASAIAAARWLVPLLLVLGDNGGCSGRSSGDGGGSNQISGAERSAFEQYQGRFADALCRHYETCGFNESADFEECVGDIREEMAEEATCDEVVRFYTAHQAEADACLDGGGSCDNDDLDTFCPVLAQLDLEHVCQEPPAPDVEPDVPGDTPDQPTTLAAQAVGYWSTLGTSCPTEFSGYVYILCPGGRVRGYGQISNVIEGVCGTYSVTRHVYEGCNDRVGCYDRVELSYRQTLAIGGETDIDPTATRDLYMVEGTLGQQVSCDDGSQGWLSLGRIAADAADMDCYSETCSSGGAGDGGGYGSCGTDCDCGRCWFCDTSGGSNTCRYGGEGPYGCYRGCGG